MIGIPLASAIGGPVGGLLLGLDGKRGLAGWQWLFLVEGMPALILGVTALRYLTDHVRDATWLSAPERAWLGETLESERLAALGRAHTKFKEIFRSSKVGLLTLIYFFFAVILYGLTLWLPLMIRDQLGLPNARVGLVIGLLGLCSAASMLLNSHTDRSASVHSTRCADPARPVRSRSQRSSARDRWPSALGARHRPSCDGGVLVPAKNGATGTAAAGGIALINAVGNLWIRRPERAGRTRTPPGHTRWRCDAGGGRLVAAGLLLKPRKGEGG
jgi:ACS family tartrate transporter-like MFS transporter